MKNPSFIFGTMHIKDQRAFGFSDSVMLAIKKSEVFALEIQPDTMMQAVMKETLNPDTIRNGTFNSENTGSSSKTDEDGTRKKRNTFVDAYLYGIAKTLDKSIMGLEQVSKISEKT